MVKIFRSSVIMLFVMALMVVPFKGIVSANVHANGIPNNKATCELRMAERQLWIDHVLWTRSFIVSDLANLEDKSDVLERLLKNQDDIGNSIKPYYGEEAGNKLTKILREHIELAGQVTNAAKTGNTADLEKYNKLWYKNADDIADFLSAANPNYSNKELKDMLYKHLQFLTDQVVARLSKDWKADIVAFDKGEEHMIMFADMLVDGIIKQFPKKFK
ncbi:MAG: glycosyltransferase [Candidatus Pristimantibacillus lignocellulolyticus]|uniref:Glycosyltransferase n=1 Tax=Candidatus Pristimantibacillus lignocellulolyticus TaxID=2994561 RepID=A0A9J6Z981_9BACL|nr:MAG: glycosyltransferase [Candidatus Pristimantibacillus lignocellulolyticus]